MLKHPQHALGSGGFAAQERLQHLIGGDPDVGGGAADASLPLLAAGSLPLGISGIAGSDAGGVLSRTRTSLARPPAPPLTASSTTCGAASSAGSDSTRYMCIYLYVCIYVYLSFYLCML